MYLYFSGCRVVSGVGCRVTGVGCRVSGGWISWNYNQLSQAKAEAETEFGNFWLLLFTILISVYY